MFDHKKMQDFTDKYLERVQTTPVSSVTQEEIEQVYKTLIEILSYHNRLYYIKAQPIIADGQYDALFSYLQNLEKREGLTIDPNSPTQRLVYQLQSEFFQAPHKIPLLSLENSYNAMDLAERDESIRKSYAKENIVEFTYICEPKYDWICVELVYEGGELKYGITRGDWYIGEDITQNIKTLLSIPLTLDTHEVKTLRVRWEIVMSKKALERVNTERRQNNEPEFANVRNAASGSLRQLDTSVTAKRWLIYYAYEILEIEAHDVYMMNTDFDALARLQKQWFTMHSWLKTCNTIDEVIAICESPATKNYFDSEDIEFDGIVVKVHELPLRNLLGSTNHHPRRAMAYKFPTKQVVTRITSVDFQVGRTGVITPAANLEPVELGWVTISRASLHNFDFIRDKDIRIWDRVWLQRSWEVIPYVVGAITERRTWEESSISIPTACPECGGVIEKWKSDIYVYCTNPDCPAKIIWQILYFCSRDALNIDWIGDSLVELLVKQWLVKNIADLYSLEEPQARLQLLSQSGVWQRKYAELIEEIKKTKVAPLRRLINGLGIMHIGKKTAQIIVEWLLAHISEDEKKNFSIYTLENHLTNHEFLLNIKGIWPETVTSLEQRFSNEKNRTLLEKMASKWVAWNIFDTRSAVKGKLNGVSICISGVFAIPRKILSDIITKHGGIVTDNITLQTSYLLLWENPSSKVEKAKEYNIPTIDGLDRLEQKFEFLKGDIGAMKLFAKEKKVEKPKQDSLF